MDVLCTADLCPVILNATCVFYEGNNLLYTGINTNDSLQTALQKIDAKFGDAMVGYTFTNGVYQSVAGAPVGLGGSLTADTTIGGNFTLTFAGNVRAAKHITTGGTSSQFVKGDGTLDSTAYQAAGNYITALTGDVIANGPGSVAASLAVVNTNPGTYGSGSLIPVVTVDTKGRVTALTTTAINVPSGILSFVGDVYGSGTTGSSTTLTLTNVNSNIYNSNTFLKFKVNAKGLVTGAAPITHVDIEGVLGYVPVPETRTISINGIVRDLQTNAVFTLPGGGSVTSVSATAGTGISVSVINATTTPNITITNTAPDQVVSIGAGSGINVSGTYPNFTVAATGSANAITDLIGEATASGPGVATVTLSTPAVTGKLLTGVNITGGTVVATDTILEGFGKLQNQINGLIGGSVYQGVWDASTNTPTLTSSVGTNGYYYIVNVAGSTNLNGITDWKVGDWAIFHDTTWQKVDNTDAVVSVNGYTGAVSLVSSDIPEGLTNLYYTPARARTAISLSTSGSAGAATYNNLTGVLNIPVYITTGAQTFLGSKTFSSTLFGTGAQFTGNVVVDGNFETNSTSTYIANATNKSAIVYIAGSPLSSPYTRDVYIASNGNAGTSTNLYLGVNAAGSINNVYIGNDDATGVFAKGQWFFSDIYPTTAVGYSVPGGTSSQYLMADGSVSTGPSLTGYVPYTGATTNVNLGENGITAGYVGFDLTPTGTPTGVGTMYWDPVYRTVNLIDGDGDTTLQIGQEERILVHNNTGATLTDGQVVYVTGSTGNLPSVSLADASSEATSAATLGVVTETIANGADGFITVSGIVNGLNTLAFNEGDLLWLGTTPGTFSTTKPISPAHLVLIGYVIKKAGGNGSILVKIQNTQELSESSDVLISAPEIDGQGLFLQTISGVQLWRNRTIADVLGYTPANAANYVPYTGATQAVNLGAYDLTVNGIKVGKGGSAAYDSTVLGDGALNANTSGSSNTAIGYYSLNANTISGGNTAIGAYSLINNVSGGNNTAIGYNAGESITTGSNNVIIGGYAGTAAMASNVILSDGAGNIRFQWDGTNIKLNGNTIGSNAYTSTAFTPQARTLTINGTTYDLSADRSWTIASGVTSFNTRTGAITLTSSDVTGALGYTPANGANYLPLTGGTLSGTLGIATNTNTLSINSDGLTIVNTDWGTVYGKFIRNSTAVDIWASGPSSAGLLALSLDPYHNTSVFSTNLTATSFVKSGGTSAQILAADGSVITAGTNITISGGVISSTGGGGSYLPLSGGTLTGALSGTSATFSGLTVDNNQNASTWIIAKNQNAGSGAAAGFLMTNNTGDLGAISLLSSGNSPANGLFIRTLSTNSLILGTNSTANLTIANGGAATFSSSVTATQGIFRTDQNAYTWSRIDNQANNASAYAGLQLGAYGNTWGIAIGSSLANSNALNFVIDAGGTNSTKMTITSSGNVGIGTTSPMSFGSFTNLTIASSATNNFSAIFLVNSSVSIRGSWYQNGGNQINFGTATAHPLVFDTSDVERMRITSGGNVGIGTSSPTNRLSLFESTGSTTSTLDFLTTGNSIKGHVGMFANNFYITSNWFYNGSQNADSLSYGQAAITFDTSTSNGFLSFATAVAGSTFPSERMRITSTGFVGLGTPFPTGMLHIYNSNPAFRIQNSAGGNMQFGQWDAVNNRIEGSGGLPMLITSYGQPIKLGIDGSEHMRIATSGYVGIGTTVPTAPLQVAGDVRSQGLRLNINTSNYGHRIYSRTMDVSAYSTQTNMRFSIASGNNVQFQYEITFHATRLSGTLAEIWYLRYTAGIAYDTAGNPNERWWDLREQAGNGIAGVGRSNSNGFFDITNSAFDTSCRLTCVVKITCNNWDAVTITFP